MNRVAIDILTELRALTQYGLSAETLLTYLRATNHRDLSLPDLKEQLRNLADNSFVTAYASALGGQRWRITGLGLSALKEASL